MLDKPTADPGVGSMNQFRSGGVSLAAKRTPKRLGTKWEWDRTTVYVVLAALAFVAMVVFEVMRLRGPLEPQRHGARRRHAARLAMVRGVSVGMCGRSA